MSDAPYCAIYDFELLPYALGDVLTWNVQTAIKAAEAGKSQVDIYICADPQYPASIYQRGLVVSDNQFLYFNELLGAFGTHPNLGNIHIFTSRDQLLERLRAATAGDDVDATALSEYEGTLAKRSNEDALNSYFLKYIYSHETLNAYAARHGGIPLLLPSRGCEPDVTGLLTLALASKRVVVIHPRLRKLDHGLGGDHTYQRDSDFLEWFGFIRAAEKSFPDVQFVLVGRLQEKPLELLRLPNVISLRTLGLGLGHELTLMQKADLFIGTSSGFAAMANFSETPYFITQMNKESCKAYAIPENAPTLPFAKPDQLLIYERETTPMLLSLLERGLARTPRRTDAVDRVREMEVDPAIFARTRGAWLYPGATSGRLFTDNHQADQEAAFLVSHHIENGLDAVSRGRKQEGAAIADRINQNFPRLRNRYEALSTLSDRTSKPNLMRQLFWRGRKALLSISGTILPKSLRGTVVHRAARRAKDAILGYQRR